MRALPVALLLSCCLLAACGDEKSEAEKAALGEDGLPKPANASGSVTGMPNPGVAEPRPVAVAPAVQETDIADVPEPLPEDQMPPPAVDEPPPPPPPPSGSPENVPLPPLEPTAPPPPPPEQ
jgi:hypothetical protein